MDSPRTFEITRWSDIDHEADIAKMAAQFTGSNYGDSRMLRRGLMPELEAALGAGREEAIQRLLTDQPYLLQYVIPNSGHHGIWVFPKQMIRMKASDGTPGLIPDFIVATRNSLGYQWHIVELKLATVQFSNRKGDGYTQDASKGIAQCHRYRTHFADYIDAVRSSVRIPEIVTPDSVILLIGDSTTETDAERQCRAEFDRSTPQMSIVSYNRIRRGLANDQRHRADLGFA